MDIFDVSDADVNGVLAGPADDPAERGPWADDDPFTPTDDDERWWASTSNAAAADFDVAEDPAAGPELEWPGSREEYERWLDGLAPTADELEARDRTDAFLGH